jgi:hypothetical protein
VTNHDSSGNFLIDRKSFPLNDNRLEKSPEFVLHLCKCAALPPPIGSEVPS